MQPATNAEQNNGIHAVIKSKSNNNCPTENPAAQTVKREAKASGHGPENFLKTPSAKQRLKKLMKKINTEFETKIELKQARMNPKAERCLGFGQ